MATTPRKPPPRTEASPANPPAGKTATAESGREYTDFVISAERLDARRIRVAVPSCPAGPLREAVTVAFGEREARQLRDSFRIGMNAGQGRALITQGEAAAIGQRLADVLLPPPVWQRLERSLGPVTRGRDGGLRIRLTLAESLIDLPWEYLRCPDRRGHEGVSGFLLFDPAISLVRLKPRRGIRPTLIDGAQRLNFVGTFWEGRMDGWEVWREFDQLRRGLKKVEKFVKSEFAVASDLDVFDEGIEADTAIFHYAGHVDFEADGRAFLVRELPRSTGLDAAHKIALSRVAAVLRRKPVRLVFMSACNSGFWPAVQPLVAARVPVVIGLK